jgi:curved DNA-binding protein CbpA
MADKTLYDILEVSSGASPEIIRAAYERLSAKCDPDSAANRTNPGARIQYEAVKEAFLTIGNPQKRTQYDKELEARSRAVFQKVEIVEPFWTTPKLIVLAVIVVFGGGYYYKHKQTEVRLAAEKAIAEARAKEAEEKARAEAEQARFALQRQQQERIADERARRESEQALRQFSVEQRLQNRSSDVSGMRERQEQQRAEYQRQREEQQAAAAARAQAAREKAELCRLERERYGRSISC